MQAARRTWRLGQTQPVAVWYVVYRDTMEHRAAVLIGQKLAAAKLLYGDAVEGALIQNADPGRGLLSELARSAIDGAQVVDLRTYFKKASLAGNGNGPAGNGSKNGNGNENENGRGHVDDTALQPAPFVPVMPLSLPILVASPGNDKGHADNGNGHPAPFVPVMPLTLPLANPVTSGENVHADNGNEHTAPVVPGMPLPLPLVATRTNEIDSRATDALTIVPVVVKKARQLALF